MRMCLACVIVFVNLFSVFYWAVVQQEDKFRAVVANHETDNVYMYFSSTVGRSSTALSLVSLKSSGQFVSVTVSDSFDPYKSP